MHAGYIAVRWGRVGGPGVVGVPCRHVCQPRLRPAESSGSPPQWHRPLTWRLCTSFRTRTVAVMQARSGPRLAGRPMHMPIRRIGHVRTRNCSTSACAALGLAACAAVYRSRYEGDLSSWGRTRDDPHRAAASESDHTLSSGLSPRGSRDGEQRQEFDMEKAKRALVYNVGGSGGGVREVGRAGLVVGCVCGGERRCRRRCHHGRVVDVWQDGLNTRPWRSCVSVHVLVFMTTA